VSQQLTDGVGKVANEAREFADSFAQTLSTADLEQRIKRLDKDAK
jgi:hypothetical protein